MRNIILEHFNALNILFTLFFLFLNIAGFFLVSFDKKRAIRGQWRVPERSFFALAFAGGAVGTYLGMIFFRHKTKQFLFTRGIALLIILNLIIFYFLCA